ncbi:MAG: hypothetical protein C0468_00830 [Planctomyces sp.]|nr:hypothetical protein [Planctomyces sp.]
MNLLSFKDWSVRVKIVALSALTTAAAVGVLAWLGSSATSRSLLERQAEQVGVIVSERASRVESYFDLIADQMRTFSGSATVRQATAELAGAFEAAPADLAKAGLDAAALRTELAGFFAREYKPRLESGGVAYRGVSAYTPADPAGAALQGLYIAGNPNPPGEKHKLDTSGKGIGYDDAHARYHPEFRAFLEAFELYDIFLMDTEGNTVYTVFKEADFATNMLAGPYAQTGLAQAYRAAMKSEAGRATLVDFARYEPSYGAPASFIAAPVFDGERRVGVVAFQMPIGRINGIMTGQTGLGTTGDCVIVGADGLMRSQSRHSETNTILMPAGEDAPAGTTRQFGGATLDGETMKVTRKAAIEGVDWHVTGTIALREVLAPVRAATRTIVTAGVIITAVALVPAFLLGTLIRRPIMVVVRAAQGLASGSFQGRIPADRGDELGQLARGVNGMLDLIAQIIGEVRTSASNVATASIELADQSKGTAQTAHEQEREITSVAGAVEEMASSIRSISEQCAQAAGQSHESGKAAAEGSQVVLSTIGEVKAVASSVRATSGQVRALGERSKQISQIIQVIDDIADQTNLLALNAAIEAARAGESGRGFAVVADEVRKLAERTGTATKEIAGNIQSMVRDTVEAAEGIEQGAKRAESVAGNADSAARTLHEIVEHSKGIGVVVERIAAAVSQQGPAATHIAEVVGHLRTMNAQTARAAGETAQVTESMSQRATDLQRLADRFRI